MAAKKATKKLKKDKIQPKKTLRKLDSLSFGA
jgi:hypothetical protein